MATATSTGTPYRTTISAGGFEIVADTESRGVGGDTGMRPHDLLDGALASCIAMTVRIAADVRQTKLDHVVADVTHDVIDGIAVFTCTLLLVGELSDKERAGLSRVAHHCPISKMLEGEISIEISEVSAN